MAAQTPVKNLPDPSPAGGLSELWRKHGTKLLLVFAAAMLAYAGVQYKRNLDNQQSGAVDSALANAWRGVEEIQQQAASMTAPSPVQVTVREQIESDVNQAVEIVLSSGDGAKNAPHVASAWLARGELFWAMAHLWAAPPSTQPTSQPAASQPVKDYLSLAAAAYSKIVSEYPNEPEPATLARFGLAAVAEDRRDIAEARKQYQALLDTPTISPADKSMAESRLASLNQYEKPVLLLPATQPVAPATAPSVSLPKLDFNMGPAPASPSTQPAK